MIIMEKEIKNKYNEIVDLLKKWCGEEEYARVDISLKDLDLLPEEEQKHYTFLFQQFYKLLTRNQRQVIENKIEGLRALLKDYNFRSN